MSVVDAAAATDALLSRAGVSAAAREAMTDRLEVPAIFPAEVTSAVRGLLLREQIDQLAANDTRQRLSRVRMRLHPFLPYAERIWELRANLTVYDAWYVAVAEALRQPLVTSDSAILDAPGLRCRLIDARG